MSNHIPLISSGVAGPLGVIHLPRLWQKASLEACGKLHPDYPGIGKGYDSMVLAALGLSEAAVRDFIKSKKPSYTQFEAWIKTQPGVKLDKASIDKNSRHSSNAFNMASSPKCLVNLTKEKRIRSMSRKVKVGRLFVGGSFKRMRAETASQVLTDSMSMLCVMIRRVKSMALANGPQMSGAMYETDR